MHRIFPVLSLFALSFLGATMFVAWSPLHFLSGLAAALAVMFVHGLSVTWFIGTGRWCKEVAATYSLDPALVARSSALKRGAFPLAVLSMLAVLVLAALGAAADPAAAMPPPKWGRFTWANYHFAAALAGLAIVLLASIQEWIKIRQHRDLIQQILSEVQRIRREKGLD